MKTATTHYAKTHLSRLIKDVQHGETVIILHGTVPAATLTAVSAEHAPARPKSGTMTSGPVNYAEDAFTPLCDDQLKEWGL